MIAIVVCVAIFGNQCSVAWAASNTNEPVKEYVSDVVLSTADKEEDAKKWLRQNGYQVVDEDLNDGTGENYVYLGFKTTNNADEAITDLRIMNENGGFTTESYRSILEKNYKEVYVLAEEMKTACAEFRTNYRNGSPNAVLAKEILDLMTADDDGTPLGDWMLDPARQNNDYFEMMIMCNTSILGLVYQELAMGVSDYGENGTWMDRLSQLDLDVFNDPDGQKTLDSAYHDVASKLADRVTEFAQAYDKAKEAEAEGLLEEEDHAGDAVLLITGEYLDKTYRVGASEEEASTEEETETETEEIQSSEDLTETEQQTEVPESAENRTPEELSPEESTPETEQSAPETESVPETSAETNAAEESSVPETEATEESAASSEQEAVQAALTGSILGGGTPVVHRAAAVASVGVSEESEPEEATSGTPLMQYLTGLADADMKDNFRALYPLVSSLTPGQQAIVRITGFQTLCDFCINTKENAADLRAQMDEQFQKIQELNDGKCVSVWMGANLDFLEESYGVTSDAKVHLAAKQDLAKLTMTNSVDQDMMLALQMIGGIAASCAAIAVLSLGITSIVLGTSIAGVFALGVFAACYTTALTVFLAVTGVGAVVVLALAAVAAIVIGMYYLVNWIIDRYNYYHPTYTDIPAIMYDYDDTTTNYCSYMAVMERDTGKPGDLNGFRGHTWNALYYTKDSGTGSPLRVQDGVAFQVKQGSGIKRAGYQELRHFGYVTAENCNRDAYKDRVKGIYVYYYTDESLAYSGTAIGGANDYLSALKIVHYDTLALAREALRSEGYEIFTENLTPEYDECSWLGYKRTSNANDAIRDIRVTYRYPAESLTYGDHGYGNAGTLGSYTMYYSIQAGAGDPINASTLTTSTSLKGPETGYIPVSFFGSGVAANFTSMSEEENWWEKGDWNDTPLYLYFQPSVVYTSGTKYVTGLGIIAGGAVDGISIENYAEKLGMTVASGDLANDSSDASSGYHEKICYTWSYYPNRAITDVKYYRTKSTKTETLQSYIAYNGAVYAAAEVFTQGDKKYYGGKKAGRTIRDSHSYFSGTQEGKGGQSDYQLLSSQRNERHVSVLLQNLFMAGPTAGSTGLAVDDLVFTSSAEAPSGYVSVKEFDNPYSTESLELSYRGSMSLADLKRYSRTDIEHAREVSDYEFLPYRRDCVHLYLRGTDETAESKGKYISELAIGSANAGTDAADQALFSLFGQILGSTSTDRKGNVTVVSQEAEMLQYNIAVITSRIAKIIQQVVSEDMALVTVQNTEWMQKWSKYTEVLTETEDAVPAAFVKVARTNNSSKAVTNIVCQAVSSGAETPHSMRYDGFTYYRTENPIREGSDGDVYLYWTTAPSAGTPVTGIYFTTETTYGGNDETAASWVNEENALAQQMKASWSLVMKHDTADDHYLKKITVAGDCHVSFTTGAYSFDEKTIRENLKKSQYCYTDVEFVRYSGYLNRFLVGYNRASTKEANSSGIKDVIFVVRPKGQDVPEKYVKNGITYYLTDTSVSMQTITGGFFNRQLENWKLYIYYTKNPRAGKAMTEDDFIDRLRNFEKEADIGEGPVGTAGSIFDTANPGLLLAGPFLLMVTAMFIPIRRKKKVLATE